MTHFTRYITKAKTLWLSLLVLTACSLSTGGIKYDSSLVPIFGQIKVKEGNCMPGPNSPPCKSIGKKAILLVCKSSESYVKDNLVLKIESDARGYFKGRIAEGHYSLFVEYQGETHCPNTICNAECYCMPISVSSDKKDSILVELNLAVY
jgi:hypothetical protein